MANRNFSSGGKIYAMHTSPVLLDCNFIVDSTQASGIRALKGPTIKSVTMRGPGVVSSNPPAGSPVLGTSKNFAILAASTITNTGSSVITGDLGLYAGTSVTGFPPGTVIGVQHITDSVANQGQIDATAAYTALQALASTVIPSALDAQVLTAGVYSFASGAATLATSAPGVLTFSGSATDIFIIKTASTLTTGAGGAATMVFTGGALASNVYWAIGSSATINVTGASAFKGHLIAQVSVTIGGGTVDGNLVALTGAITISAASIITNVSSSSSTTTGPLAGTIVVKLVDGYNRSLSGFSNVITGLAATNTSIDNSVLVIGTAYVISVLGNAPASKWYAIGVPIGVKPAVGVSFIASSTGGAGNILISKVVTAQATGSGIVTIEVLGDPTLSSNPLASANQGFGAQFILQCRGYSGALAAPVDGTVISLAFLLSNSSIIVQGE